MRPLLRGGPPRGPPAGIRVQPLPRAGNLFGPNHRTDARGLIFCWRTLRRSFPC